MILVRKRENYRKRRKDRKRKREIFYRNRKKVDFMTSSLTKTYNQSARIPSVKTRSKYIKTIYQDLDKVSRNQ